MKVHYRNETKLFCFNEGSQKHFYTGLLCARKKETGRQGFTVAAANRNPCILMLLNLVCSSSSLPRRIESQKLGDVVQAMGKASFALSGWNSLTKEMKRKYLFDTANVSEVVNTPADHTLPLASSQLPLLDAFKTELLCIPLKRDYCKEHLSFSSLLGEDALVAGVLGAIDFINIELGLIRSIPTQQSDWKETVMKQETTALLINRRIPAEPRHLQPYKSLFTFGRNVIGNFKGKISCPNASTATCTLCPPPNPPSHSSQYIAFLISPKGLEEQKDQLTFLAYYLNELTKQLPNVLERKSHGNNHQFNNTKNEVDQIIATVSCLAKQAHKLEHCPNPHSIKPLLILCENLQATESFQTLLTFLFNDNGFCFCGYEKLKTQKIPKDVYERSVCCLIAQCIVTLKGNKSSAF